MPKNVKKIILIVVAILLLVSATVVAQQIYCKMNATTSQYKYYKVINLDHAVLSNDCDEELLLDKNMIVYSQMSTSALQLGELTDGDIVMVVSESTDGWREIVYNGNQAYLKTIGLVENGTTVYNQTDDALYITPEEIEVVSVNKSKVATQTLNIQTLVDRVAVGTNGVSKILYDGCEYYIPTEFLSEEKPVIWTEPEIENMIIGSFDGVDILSDFRDETSVIGNIGWTGEVKHISVGDNGWSKILFDDKEGYIKTDSMVEGIYPIVYEDETCKITITKEWYKKAWCYTAHLEFTDYTRLSTDCGNGKYGGGYETTSHAAERLNALFAVNGCYSAPYLGYTVVRGGVIRNGAGRAMNLPGVYSSHTGLFSCAWSSGGASGIVGRNVTTLVNEGKVTDTFCFGPPSLVNGYLKGSGGGARAQRTMMGTNGNPGDIWIVVSDGRYNDGESAGLTFYEGAQYLKELGCTFGIHLDGGGSSTMYFNGKVLNAVAGNERAVVDFVYFK